MHAKTVEFLQSGGITVLNDASSGQHAVVLDSPLEAGEWIDTTTTELVCLPAIVAPYRVALSYGSEGAVYALDDFPTGQSWLDAVRGAIHRVCAGDQLVRQMDAAEAEHRTACDAVDRARTALRATPIGSAEAREATDVLDAARERRSLAAARVKILRERAGRAG